jgi:hypothetical protein
MRRTCRPPSSGRHTFTQARPGLHVSLFPLTLERHFTHIHIRRPALVVRGWVVGAGACPTVKCSVVLPRLSTSLAHQQACAFNRSLAHADALQSVSFAVPPGLRLSDLGWGLGIRIPRQGKAVPTRTACRATLHHHHSACALRIRGTGYDAARCVCDVCVQGLATREKVKQAGVARGETIPQTISPLPPTSPRRRPKGPSLPTPSLVCIPGELLCSRRRPACPLES